MGSAVRLQVRRARDKFVRDFAAAWVKVSEADRFDLR